MMIYIVKNMLMIKPQLIYIMVEVVVLQATKNVLSPIVMCLETKIMILVLIALMEQLQL